MTGVVPDPHQLARAVILRQLAAGPRTRAQLVAALRRARIPDEVSEQLLVRFEDVQLIDDREFARQWVETRHHGRGLAARALAYELRHRGVAAAVVTDAVSRVGPEEELAAARRLIRRRARGVAHDEPQRRTRRLAAMLARKGYGPGLAMRAIRAELPFLTAACDELGDLETPPDHDALPGEHGET